MSGRSIHIFLVDGTVSGLRSFQPTYKSLRAQLINSGLLVEEGDSYVFTQDVAFSSISGAAQFVSGQTVNGRTAWKIADTNQTYAEWQDSRIPQTNDS